jgi:hypothetical protein
MTDNTIPDDLKSLLSLGDEWALPTHRQRQEKRATSSMQQLQAFYDALKPRIMQIGEYLDHLDTSELTTAQQRLFAMALMYMEAALAVETYGSQESPMSFERDRFVDPDNQASSI